MGVFMGIKVSRIANKIRKKRYGGNLSSGDAVVSIRNLKGSRTIRNGLFLTGVVGGTAGAVLGFEIREGLRGVFAQPVMTRENLAIAGAAGAGLGAVGRLLMRGNVRQATHNVGAALHKAARSNGELREFLARHKYIFIDRKGRVVGTNTKGILGAGRMRLETIKILKGEYEKGTI